MSKDKLEPKTAGFSEHIVVGTVGNVLAGQKSGGQYVVNFSLNVTPWLKRFGWKRSTCYECVIWGYRAEIFVELGFIKGDP
ncbi:MAG: single-stranded DNA-binding protein, partial [Deltaproteobacteria bacterium]|nr:single-stranded DNA-binding protein [Deltaproteobacteria bacterium]